MTLLQSIFLGIIQGLTEFLPISSSGHLVIIPHLLGWQIPSNDAFIFDVLVQVATLIGVVAYFWRDLIDITQAFLKGLWNKQPFQHPNSLLGWYLILATIPAGIFGLLFEDIVESAFSSVRTTAFSLLITAILLLIAERAGKRLHTIKEMTWKDAITMGFFQVLALFPGISRSGSTITGGMTRHLERSAAARFSFLMSIPIMLAAGLISLTDLLNKPNLLELIPVYIPGFLAAAVTGYLSIRWLIGFLTRKPLYVFIYYCTALGVLTLVFSLF